MSDEIVKPKKKTDRSKQNHVSSFKNIEYFDLIKNTKTIKRYTSEIEGLSKREVEELIGSDFGSGHYVYSCKYKGVDQMKRGQIKGVDLEAINKLSKKDLLGIQPIPDNSIKVIEAINKLESKMSSGSNQDYNFILDTIKSSYQLQIDFLKDQLVEYKKQNDEMRKMLESDNKSTGLGLNDILQLVQNKDSIMSLIDLIKPKG